MSETMCFGSAAVVEARHAGHDVACLTARRADGPVGRRVCLTCDLVLGAPIRCGQPTLRGQPCRAAVRTDLGYVTCWSHGEGRGRTSTPRSKPQREESER